MKISPARIAAFDALLKIETKGAFSSILLPEYEAGLERKDAALCHELTLGVLRNQIYLDAIIDHYSSGQKLDDEVRIALRLGLYQQLFLSRIPAHSAVNESVNLVVRARRKSARGLVNAILRRSIRESFRPTAEDELDQIALETSHPRWLLERWVIEFGRDEAYHLAGSNNKPPRISFRAGRAGELESELPGTRRSETAENGFVTEKLTIDLSAAAEQGEIYFQDEGSQLVGESIKLSEGAKFLDVCAAPGSKFSQIALAHQEKDYFSVAGDIHMHRLLALRRICELQGLNGQPIVQFDAAKAIPFPNESFDAVLVDAPCSGTGTIRHNPEIRYRLKFEDIAELADKQRSILANASKIVKKGGTLVYSTCSLEREENQDIVNSFLSASQDFRSEEPPRHDHRYSNEKFIQLLPHKHGTDGFFIAYLARK